MTDTPTELEAATPPAVPATSGGIGFDIAPMWKAAEGLSRSSLMPKAFRGEPANCFLALEIASRLGLGAFEVAQNMYVVHGEPGWKATYLIGLANARGPFKGSLQFTVTGEGAAMVAECWAIHRETGERVSTSISMQQAKKAGWTSNKKYDEIPAQMLSYRAATFLVRLYCPEVTLGMKTTEELEDIAAVPAHRDIDVDPVVDDLNEAVAVKNPPQEVGVDIPGKVVLEPVNKETGEVEQTDAEWWDGESRKEEEDH